MNRALIIFAKQPAPGRVKTRLTPPLSHALAAELYGCMLADTIENHACRGHAKTLVFFEPSEGADTYFRETWTDLDLFPQEGEGLGERLENAFGRAFDMGFGAVAAIGTDSPDLPASYVKDAFMVLEQERVDVVFGPAGDGGYCLIAMGRPYPELFREIPWSTGEALERSEERAGGLGLVTARLPVRHDLDTVEDLKRILASGDAGGAPKTMGFLSLLREQGVI